MTQRLMNTGYDVTVWKPDCHQSGRTGRGGGEEMVEAGSERILLRAGLLVLNLARGCRAKCSLGQD
jgi:hypothetical protein